MKTAVVLINPKQVDTTNTLSFPSVDILSLYRGKTPDEAVRPQIEFLPKMVQSLYTQIYKLNPSSCSCIYIVITKTPTDQQRKHNNQEVNIPTQTFGNLKASSPLYYGSTRNCGIQTHSMSLEQSLTGCIVLAPSSSWKCEARLSLTCSTDELEEWISSSCIDLASVQT